MAKQALNRQWGFASPTTISKAIAWLAMALSLLIVSGCGASLSSPTITQQPANQTVAVGESATFVVIAAGASLLSYQWQKNGANIPGATSSRYVVSAATLSDDGSAFRVKVTDSHREVTSGQAILHVVKGTDVLTYHYDNARTGLNVNEKILTTTNVKSATFGKVGFYSVDGQVNAQPLYLSQVPIPNQGAHNVVYVATEHDSVYAFDADSGSVLWHASVLGTGETTSDPIGCPQVSPEIGITATPVIDRTQNALYVVAMSKNATGSYFQRIHALDIRSGAELFNGPVDIQASYPGSGDNSAAGNVIFDPRQYNERAGLVLANGTVYTTWASHCDFRPYTSWVIGFGASTLALVDVLNLTPNGNSAAIWMSGTAPAADGSGNIYVLNGNGTFDTALDSGGFPQHGDFGNCLVKLATSGGLNVSDYFTMFNTVQESNTDEDFGSGGVLLLPDVSDSTGAVHQLAVAAGKDAHIYVVDRNAMGKFNPASNNNYQDIPGVLSNSVYGMAAYFNGTIYYGAVGDAVKAFPISNGRLPAIPGSASSTSFTYPGTTPSISADGTSNGIVWAVENSSPAVLHAYTATNLSQELYNSNQTAGGRDHFGAGNKFITPVIVDGKVYVGTPTGVAVFGLLLGR
jgi:hypothetical protein